MKKFNSLGIFSCLAVLSLTATSAMAVLPTVTLDQAEQPATTNLTFAPATPVVMNAPMAASTAQVQKRLLASVVARDATGNEVLTPVTAQTQFTTGNIIEYRGYIINQSPERVRTLKATFTLPTNTELTSISDLSPSRAYGSVDGVDFHYIPLKTNIGGVVQDIPMSSYKAVRWDIQGLGLNEVAEVKFRVRVK